MKRRYIYISIAASSIVGPPQALAEQGASGALEEVIVTARHRDESLQDAPVAISAISASQMLEQGVTNTRDLSKSVPSLQIGRSSTTQIFIRGVGERTGFSRVDPGVGVYLNDVFIPRVDGQLFDVADIASVQVLRGPQGSLFGKNTTGGAMLLALQKPTDETEFEVELGVGSYSLLKGKATVNLPVTDSLSTRLSLYSIEDDGFLEDINGENYSSNDRKAVIAQAAWNTNDRFTLDSFIYWGETREKRPGRNCRISDANGLFVEALYLNYPGDTDPSNPRVWEENCLDNSLDSVGAGNMNLGDAHNDYEYDSLQFGTTFDWEFRDGQSLKLIVGYQDALEGPHQVSDSDGGPADLLEAFTIDDSHRETYSAELRLSGDLFGERLGYTTGLFYMNEKLDDSFITQNSIIAWDATSLGTMGSGVRPPAPPPGGTLPFVGSFSRPISESVFDMENDTFGAYFQGVYELTENFSWTVGARYTEERRQTQLAFTTSDQAAISAILESHPLIGPEIAPGTGLHPFFGGWSQDPAGTAAALFRDADGDGVIDYPMDRANTNYEQASIKFYKFTPMTSLSYSFYDDWMDDMSVDGLMLYTTWSNGFKSGFFEPRGADGLVFIEPEELENLEFGVKLDAFGRSVRVNASAYLMDYENIQLLQIATDRMNNTAVSMANAGKATIRGVELEMSMLPTPEFMIQLSYSYNNYSYDEFNDLEMLPLIVSGDRVPVDRSSEAFSVVPESKAYLSFQYELATDLGTFVPRVDVSYTDEIYYGIDSGSWAAYQDDHARAGAPSSTVANARLTWLSSSGDFSVSAYVNNFTDEEYQEGGSAAADTLGTFIITPASPRTWGLEFRKIFN